MLLVVGGQARKTGKTSLTAGLIRRLRRHRWTALKITQYGRTPCSRHKGPESCECAPPEGAEFALTEEYTPGATDSGRFLAAGAVRSFWLQAPAGELPRAASLLRKVLAQGENVIVESTSLVELVKPDLFLMLLDFGCQDFKDSSLRFIDRADAFVVVDRGINAPLWEGVAAGVWDHKPRFLIEPPPWVTPQLADFVEAKLAAAR